MLKKDGYHIKKRRGAAQDPDLDKIYVANSAAFIAPIFVIKNLITICRSPKPILLQNEIDGFDIDNLKIL